jgi:hypothetical protein
VSDHRDVREALELAAVEPGGLDRLEAGDAPDAAAIAGHLAGCPDCLEELARLRRADTLLRPMLATQPDPALRERTLALVRDVGVWRGARAGAGGEAADDAVEVPRVVPATGAVPDARPRRRAAWLGAIAAALVVGLVGGALVVGSATPGGNADPATALSAVTGEVTALLDGGDARQLVLVDDTGATAGSLVLSPSAGRLVVVANGLPPAGAGSEYLCWVEIGGTRLPLGTMWRAGDVEWWAGDVAIPAEIPPGIVYGVSRVTSGSTGPGTVVLSGTL